MRPRTTGLLLAAGAGRRFGMPKGLVVQDGVAWVQLAAGALLDGGCADVLVVTGAQAEGVEELLEPLQERGEPVTTVRCSTWERGMGESLRAGLTALATRGRTIPQQALVHLVDLPDVGADVVARVLGEAGSGTDALARAAYDGIPGHPVLLGQEHWEPALARSHGDSGARSYLRTAGTVLIECGDLAAGLDRDQPLG